MSQLQTPVKGETQQQFSAAVLTVLEQQQFSAAVLTVLESVESEPAKYGGWKMHDALMHLLRIEPRFESIIEKHGLPKSFQQLHMKERPNPFPTLVKTIIYQQLAPAAAGKIMERCFTAMGLHKGASIEPQQILSSTWTIAFVDGKKKVLVDGEQSGLSENKMKALQSLASHFLDEECLKGVDLYSLPTAELSERLQAIR